LTTDSKQAYFPYKIRLFRSSRAGRFLLHFLELQIPMTSGAFVCYLMGRLIPASSSYATAYHPGTYLYTAADVLFLSVPVALWMVLRGHGWRHSAEMAVAMIAPVAAIMVLGELTGYAYRLWLLTAGYPAMSLGMLIDMLYHRDHFTRRVGHLVHAEDY
jgi:hypothetical protein